jgi:hypothetical protein
VSSHTQEVLKPFLAEQTKIAAAEKEKRLNPKRSKKCQKAEQEEDDDQEEEEASENQDKTEDENDTDLVVDPVIFKQCQEYIENVSLLLMTRKMLEFVHSDSKKWSEHWFHTDRNGNLRSSTGAYNYMLEYSKGKLPGRNLHTREQLDAIEVFACI